MFENRRWLIISSSLTGSLDFNEVLQHSAETMRYSIDGAKTFVKYDITEVTQSYNEYTEDANNPGVYLTSSVAAGIYGRPSIFQEGDTEYTHTEIIDILAGPEWSDTNITGSL